MFWKEEEMIEVEGVQILRLDLKLGRATGS